MFISKTTSVGAKNFPPANAPNTAPIPPSILNNKNPKANVTPTINTIPWIKSVHNTDFNPPVYEYIIAITPITIINKLTFIPVSCANTMEGKYIIIDIRPIW